MIARTLSLTAAAILLLSGCTAGGTDNPPMPMGSHSAAGGHEGHSSAANVTPEQQAAADELVTETKKSLGRFADAQAAEKAGYRWIGDGAASGQYRHFVNPQLLLDDKTLEPSAVESLVYQTNDDKSLTLVSGMYILKPGTTMDDAPDVAGELTPWHEHDNLCFATNGTIAGIVDDGECPADSFNTVTPPMLHVWVVDNPGGPFAGIDVGGSTHTDH